MGVRLILIRHAKSDWNAGVSDRDRPLNGRGRSQAPETGEWLAGRFGDVDLAVVSVAARARETWELVSRHLSADEVRDAEDAYTFDGDDLADLVAGLPESASSVVLVGHNPAMEELMSSPMVRVFPSRPAFRRGGKAACEPACRIRVGSTVSSNLSRGRRPLYHGCISAVLIGGRRESATARDGEVPQLTCPLLLLAAALFEIAIVDVGVSGRGRRCGLCVVDRS